MHRALDAERAASTARGECLLTEHELESLRERDAFEKLIWFRLDYAELEQSALRERSTGVPKTRRLSIDTALQDAGVALASVEHALRRVHAISDLEWPRYKHDLESTLDGVDGMLREAR